MDAWEVIGGRLDFVQFPGNQDEPPKSGPGVAQKLKHVYQEYLLLFDQTYLRSVLAKQLHSQPRGNQPPSQATPPTNGGNVPPSTLPVPGGGNPAGMQQQVPAVPGIQALFQILGTNDITRINQILQMSLLSVEDLRKRGIPQDMINLVETHRTTLSRFAHQAQNTFRNAIKSGPLQQRPAAFGSQLRNPAQTIMAPNMPSKSCFKTEPAHSLILYLASAFQPPMSAAGASKPQNILPQTAVRPTRPTVEALQAAHTKIATWKQAAQANVQRS